MEYISSSDKIAVIEKNKEYSYNQICGYANYVSSLFNTQLGDRAIIFAENSLKWIISLVACWNNKTTVIPVDFGSSSKELTYIFNDAKPKYIFSNKEKKDLLEEALNSSSHKPKIIYLEDVQLSEKPIASIDYIEAKYPSLILYTSGTTGDPKGVMINVENILANIVPLTEDKTFASEDIYLALLPFHHILPLQSTVVCPLSIGAKIVFSPSLTSKDILDTMQKYKVTTLVGVPRLYKLFDAGIMEKINSSFIAKTLFKIAKNIKSREIRAKLFKKVHDNFGGNIKMLISGGAKLDIDIANNFNTFGMPISEGYGMTETAPMITYPDYKNVVIGSVGKPVKNTEVKIKDGEILTKGPHVMMGYLNKPEATSKTIIDGWLHTGDLGELDDDKNLYITGRKKEMIVLENGKNINPESIEKEILNISELISEIGVYDNDGILNAIVVPNFEKLKSEGISNIQETIQDTVISKYNLSCPSYRKINGINIIKGELPKTRLGKVRRFLLKDLVNNDQKKEETKIKEPKYKEYEILKKQLQKLSSKNVYPKSHLELDLQLDSLAFVELLSFISFKFGIDITQDSLIDYPTVEKLAEYLRDNETSENLDMEINWKKILDEAPKQEINEDTSFSTIFKAIVLPAMRLYFRFERRGVNNIITNKPCIFAANHQSIIDGVLVQTSLKKKVFDKTYFLAKEKYFTSNIMHYVGEHSNIVKININQNLKDSIQKLANLLKNNKNVVIFPEGTRTKNGELNEFKKIFAILSKELEVPVIPVSIDGAHKAFGVGIHFPKPTKIKINFLEPIFPQGKTIEEISDLTHSSILNDLS